MTDFSNWDITQERGEGVGFLLEHRGVSVTLRRGSSNLAAQTVLIVPTNSPRERGAAEQGQSAAQEYIVIGESDLNIQRGDTFSYLPVNAGQRNFEVNSVDRTLPGQVQARAVVVS